MKMASLKIYAWPVELVFMCTPMASLKSLPILNQVQMVTEINTNKYSIAIEHGLLDKQNNVNLKFKSYHSIGIEDVNVIFEDEVYPISDTKQELDCLLYYLCHLKDKYRYTQDEDRLKQGLDYLCDFDLFGVETYNGWLWEDIPNEAIETLHYCIAKVILYINH